MSCINGETIGIVAVCLMITAIIVAMCWAYVRMEEAHARKSGGKTNG